MTSSCLDEEVGEDEEDDIVRGAWRFKVVKQPVRYDARATRLP